MNELLVINSKQLEGFAIPEDVFQRWLSYLDVSPKTLETYTRAIRQLYKYLYARGITQPRREDIVAYRDELKNYCKPATIQNYIIAAKLFFRWLSQEGMYPNITDHLKATKVDKGYKKDYLTSAQVRDVLTGIDKSKLIGLRDYAMVTLMVTGGLRTIEVVRADVADMRTLGDHTVLYIWGKGRSGKTDYVKVSPQVEHSIRAYLSLRGKANGNEPLFASASNNNIGGRMSTRAVRGIVKHHLVNAGYDSNRLTAHSLRHTAVTLSLLAGRDITEVQQFARHANINTTMIYNHALDRANNSCGEAISNTIFG